MHQLLHRVLFRKISVTIISKFFNSVYLSVAFQTLAAFGKDHQSLVSQLLLYCGDQHPWLSLLHSSFTATTAVFTASINAYMIACFNVSVSAIFPLLPLLYGMPVFYFWYHVMLFTLYEITLMAVMIVYCLSFNIYNYGMPEYIFLYLHAIHWFIYMSLPYINALLAVNITLVIGSDYTLCTRIYRLIHRLLSVTPNFGWRIAKVNYNYLI